MGDYKAAENRYKNVEGTGFYRHCGKSGLMMPPLALGLWHNFGTNDDYENMKKMCFTAFDNGITHFDIANNYGPVYGSAEENFGKILREELGAYRDELIISTKAGFDMWEGPYGNWGSRKYLIASLDQSLKRLGIPYVDIFYHHRMDPNTPLEETMGALAQIVKSGKALYVGLSNYDGPTMAKAERILDELHVPFVINQTGQICREQWASEADIRIRQGTHMLLASGTGNADRQISEGYAGGQQGSEGRKIPS